MAVREIRYFGDPVLLTPCEQVTRFDSSLQTLVADLMDTVEAPGRAGVAAPQIGVSLRVFSYRMDGKHGYIVNPEIAELSREEQDGPEGCLSVPELWFPTRRAREATVRGVDMHGDPVVLEGSGELARCFQHEIDHLDGKLYLSRLEPDHRKRALRDARHQNWFWSRS